MITQFNGREVYVDSKQSLTNQDFDASRKDDGTITDAYFFKLERGHNGFRNIVKIPYDSQLIESEESGLMVEIKGQLGTASTSVGGLERITDLLCESRITDLDVSKLVGRSVIQFGTTSKAYGFSFKYNK